MQTCSRATTFDDLPEDLQLKILRLALFEEAELDEETRKNALRVECLKRPEVVPTRTHETPLDHDPTPSGIMRSIDAAATAARLCTVSRGFQTLAKDEKLWAEALALFEEVYGSGDRRENRARSPAILYVYSDDWAELSSFQKYGSLLPDVRWLINLFFHVYEGIADFMAEALADAVITFTLNLDTKSCVEFTDKFPCNFYEEVFTTNVASRLLYNEYGRAFASGRDKRRMRRIMNNPDDGDAALCWNDDSHDEFREHVVDACYAKLIGQGYVRLKKGMHDVVTDVSRKDPAYLN